MAAGHWCHGCRSGGVLWLQQGRRCTHASPQRCAPAKVGYERCRRTPKETPDRVSLHFRSASRQLASGCKDTRRGTIPRRVDVAGPGIGRVSSKAPSSSSSADPRPRRGGFTFPRWTRSRRRRGGFGRHGRSSSAPAALYLRTHSSGVRGRGGHVAARPPRRVPFRCSKTRQEKIKVVD